MNVEFVREFCLSLPHVTEDVKWGHDLCFSIGGKMFCVTGLEGISMTVKVPDEEFEEISTREGFAPAPYLARYKWVLIEDVSTVPAKKLQQMITRSYELIKSKLPKKMKDKLS